jgi:hypothetical protein
MASIEKHYLELEPEDDSLLGSLHIIQAAVRSIWTPSVFIIKDFTDHGEKHSFRILNRAAILLKIFNEMGNDLSDIELYLLSASGYLHDIGMQCDVAKFPNVKLAAEDLGADFKFMDFNAEYSSHYSLEQQVGIRENHQYLTAAWIQCAKHNNNPLYKSELDHAVEQIPALLLQSLIDICIYHSGKQALNMDFRECKHDRRTRVKLIAALLRFVDELDVDLYRVDEPEKIHRNFRLPPQNIKYWWLHGRTHIYIDPNYNNEKRLIGAIIKFDVVLNPEDKKTHGNDVQEKVIRKFRDKNEKILNILTSYGMPITISDRSEVSEDSNLELIPPEIWEHI